MWKGGVIGVLEVRGPFGTGVWNGVFKEKNCL